MNQKWLVIALVALIALLIAAAAFSVAKRLAMSPTPSATPSFVAGTCRDFPEAKVKVGDKVISVALSDDDNERHQGLSDCDSMPADSGMYFIFPSPQITAFWMKDMKFPLDIIWVKDGKVTGVVENAPVPSAEAKLQDLPQYPTPGSIDAVLELNAGKAKEFGIKKGIQIQLTK